MPRTGNCGKDTKSPHTFINGTCKFCYLKETDHEPHPLPIIKALHQELTEKGYTTNRIGNQLIIMTHNLTKSVHIHNNPPHQLTLTNPQKHIDLNDPKSLDTLYQEINHRLQQ